MRASSRFQKSAKYRSRSSGHVIELGPAASALLEPPDGRVRGPELGSPLPLPDDRRLPEQRRSLEAESPTAAAVRVGGDAGGGCRSGTDRGTAVGRRVEEPVDRDRQLRVRQRASGRVLRAGRRASREPHFHHVEPKGVRSRRRRGAVVGAGLVQSRTRRRRLLRGRSGTICWSRRAAGFRLRTSCSRSRHSAVSEA